MHLVGYPFIELQSVDSTNNYAMRLAHEGVARHGTTVFAHQQTAGKGQRNKQWLTQPSQNILMSAVLEPGPVLPAPSFILSMAIAVAALSFFKKQGVDAVKIKWPNDLFIGDRKAGGILIETILHGSAWKFAVAGIGLNINQTDFGGLAAKAVSLKQITGNTYDTIALAKELCGAIDGVLKLLAQEPEAVVETYQQHLYKRNEPVRLKQGTRVFEATVLGVTTAGKLRVQHGIEETFDVGAIEWMLP